MRLVAEAGCVWSCWGLKVGIGVGLRVVFSVVFGVDMIVPP